MAMTDANKPGYPKSVRTRRPPAGPPLAIVVEPSRVTQQKTTAPEEERFSDALTGDDVSCVTVNCSTTGLSDAASACAAGARRSVPAGVMMDRFLPAAHAVAAGSPQNTFRKAASARGPTRSPAVPPSVCTGGGDWLPVQRRLPVQQIAACHLPPLPSERKNNEEEDDAESDAHSTAGFAASKRCGLLPRRCVKSACLLLSSGARRGAGRPFLLSGGGSRRAMDNPLLRRSRNGQQQHTGEDPGMQSWEEVYIKSLLRSGGGGGVMGPAAAVASELDRTVRELYKNRGGGQAVQPKASHLGLLLVLDRSNEDCGRGYHGSSAPRRISKPGETATTKTSPDAGKKLGHGVTDDAGKYGFPLLLEDSDAIAGREMALSPQPLLPLPLPKSPTESWLSRALPSVSTRRPPATSFLGLHVQPKKYGPPLPWCSMDYSKDVDHDRQRQRRVHDLQK